MPAEHGTTICVLYLLQLMVVMVVVVIAHAIFLVVYVLRAYCNDTLALLG